MTLKQIEAFYWAANLGSFGIAAQRLHVTQSSLSKRIAELEASLGTQLFDRSSQRAQLTEAGHRLVPLAGRMLELKETIRTEADVSSELIGSCRFGVSELAALTWLPTFVREARREHPRLVLQPYVDLARNLEQQVARGELDFSVAPGPVENPHVQGHTISQVEFSWIAAASRLRAGSVLTARELERHPLITMTEGSGLTRTFNAWAAEQGLNMQRTVACNSLMAIVGLTLADVGISFLPTRYMQPWIDQGNLVAVRSVPPLPSLSYYFFHRMDDTRAIVQTMKRYVIRSVDFSGASALRDAAPSQVIQKTTD